MFAAIPALTCGATFVSRFALRETQIPFGNLAAIKGSLSGNDASPKGSSTPSRENPARVGDPGSALFVPS